MRGLTVIPPDQPAGYGIVSAVLFTIGVVGVLVLGRRASRDGEYSALIEEYMTNDERIHLPDAPAISGLMFRRFRGAADYAPIVAVHEGSREWDQVDPLSSREGVPTVDSLAASFGAVSSGTPDLLIAEVAGQVIGYNHVLWRWTEVTGTRVYLHLGYLLPAWRGKGIGQAMFHWSQARIREIAAGEQTAGVKMLATNASSTEKEAGALIRANGYIEVRRLSDMKLDPLSALPPGALPAGVTRRPVHSDHYRSIYQALKDAYSDTWISTSESEADYQEFLAEEIHISGFDPTLCQVAWATDQVVGLVWCHIRKGVGVIAEVAVRKAWKRRGIARALMVYGLEALREKGITQVRLFTDAANEQGARSLYESLGFREVKQHILYRKSLAEG
ncbi:MAG TPA: GNAT family N-acetyltransferase [Ktedonobacterales bacterium]|jgi:mycothiol synthase